MATEFANLSQLTGIVTNRLHVVASLNAFSCKLLGDFSESYCFPQCLKVKLKYHSNRIDLRLFLKESKRRYFSYGLVIP